MGKYSVQIGDEHGNAPTESSQNPVAVIMLGARSNQYVIPSELLYTCQFSTDLEIL